MRDSGGWVPADEHERSGDNGITLNRADDDEYEDISDNEARSVRRAHRAEEAEALDRSASRGSRASRRKSTESVGQAAPREVEPVLDD